MRAVAGRVPDDASVLELCCGPGPLSARHLRVRVSGYIGIDVNEGSVETLTRDSADARMIDLAAGGQLPEADIVILQASLYHFLPGAEWIVERMMRPLGRFVRRRWRPADLARGAAAPGPQESSSPIMTINPHRLSELQVRRLARRNWG